MSKIYELRNYLLENYVDDFGDLDLSGLDFSDFDGDVYTRGMKVKRDLYQDYQKVKGGLYQDYQEVKGNLWQGNHKVKGNLRQGYSEIKGYYFCKDVKVGGDILTNEPTKLPKPKKITREELAEMGYEVI